MYFKMITSHFRGLVRNPCKVVRNADRKGFVVTFEMFRYLIYVIRGSLDRLGKYTLSQKYQVHGDGLFTVMSLLSVFLGKMQFVFKLLRRATGNAISK